VSDPPVGQAVNTNAAAPEPRPGRRDAYQRSLVGALGRPARHDPVPLRDEVFDRDACIGRSSEERTEEAQHCLPVGNVPTSPPSTSDTTRAPGAGWVRGLAACALLAGLVVVWVLGIALQRSPATTAATAAHCLDRQALAQFQLARSPDDLVAVFGPAGSPCRPLAVDALAATQHADFVALIPAYTVFFVAAALALAGARDRWTWLAVAVALVAAAANMVEDGIQLRIIESVQSTQPGPSGGSFDAAAVWLGSLNDGHADQVRRSRGVRRAGGDVGRAAPRRGWPEWLLGLGGLLPLPAMLVAALDPHRLGFLMALTFLLFAVVLFDMLVRLLLRPDPEATAGESLRRRTGGEA
jgi:hypothetical protein